MRQFDCYQNVSNDKVLVMRIVIVAIFVVGIVLFRENQQALANSESTVLQTDNLSPSPTPPILEKLRGKSGETGEIAQRVVCEFQRLKNLLKKFYSVFLAGFSSKIIEIFSD